MINMYFINYVPWNIYCTEMAFLGKDLSEHVHLENFHSPCFSEH